MDHKDCSGLMGRCKNCEHYAANSTMDRFGNCKKVFIKPYLGSALGQPSQQIIHIERESIFVKSKVYVMEDFGCIHFKY